MIGPTVPRRRILSTALPLCVLLTACAGDGGATVGSIPVLTATEDLRIGSTDDPDVGFSRIGGVAVDADANVYVFEGADSQIRVYDADGNRTGTLGRPGEGPGEFRSVMRFGVTGDTVWTMDMGLRRITLFDRGGRVLFAGPMQGVMVPMQASRMSGMLTPRALRPDGMMTSEMAVFIGMRDAQPSGIGENDTVMVPRVLYRPTGEPVDTIGWYPYPPPGRRETQRVEVAGTQYIVPGPPPDAPLQVLLADGGFFIDRPYPTSTATAAFSVTRFTEAGDTLFRERFEYSPVRYGDALLDTLAARSARIPGGVYSPVTGPPPTPEGVDIDAVRSSVRDAMDFPQFQMPVSWGIAGEDGSVWLRREDDGGPDYHYMLIAPDGEPRGLLSLPRTSSVRWVGADTFWAVEPDELDVPWLVRYRIGEAAGGA